MVQSEVEHSHSGLGIGDEARNVASSASEAATRSQPPITNRGVYTPKEPQNSANLQNGQVHRFDWYRCTPEAEESELIHILNYELEQLHGKLDRRAGPKTKHYETNTALFDRADNALVEILNGKNAVRPNLLARGPAAVEVATIVRQEWKHSVSRLDACADFDQEGLFEEVTDWARPFARDHGIGVSGVWSADQDKGETIYFGSRRSACFVRVYQPGLKRAKEENRTGDAITAEERNTVRFEHEHKPQNKPAKLAASGISPIDTWARSPWTAHMADKWFSMDLKPVSVSLRRTSDHERALGFMCRQYRAHLETLLNRHHGDLDGAMMELLERADLLPMKQDC